MEDQQTENSMVLRCVWTIDNVSRVSTQKLYSNIFIVGGYKWRVLIFPSGNNLQFLSMYLGVVDSGELPYGWSTNAEFSLSVVDQIQNKFTVQKKAHHQFSAQESSWGFNSFMPLSELCNPRRGYLVNGTCIVEVEVAVSEVAGYWSCDSRKETGYVGLKNQGATCYLNSLLQTLFHIPRYRKAVYDVAACEKDISSGSILLALQRLFHKLQYDDSSVSTEEFTQSLGWSKADLYTHRDVQEISLMLSQQLDNKMKFKTQKLFEGHHRSYIQCINVACKSESKESFHDLQLDVIGCKDVYASFDKYVRVEPMNHGEKYCTSDYGLQDANKIVLFLDFPPVLQLHLKRVQYDNIHNITTKVNDFYKFPLQLDLDRDGRKYFCSDADANVRNLYTLYSVIVHRGNANAGHYYAFIRPTLSDQWFKFDDENVTKEHASTALQEQYGGEEEFTKHANAYILVYIRESDKENLMFNVDERKMSEYIQVFQLRSLKKPQEDCFSVEILKTFTYDEIVERVSQIIGVDDPSKIRLTSHDCNSQLPEPQPIKCRGSERLQDIHNIQTSHILYYEVLDISLKSLIVAYYHATKDQVSLHSVKLPKNSTVRDVLDDIKSKVELSHPNVELTLLEVFYHKIYKIFEPDEIIENISDQYWTLRAEEAPDKKSIGVLDRLIHVYHFTSDIQNEKVQNFGDPFFMFISEDETLFSIKERIQKKLKVPCKDFSKWKFALVTLGKLSYLKDSFIVATGFELQREKYRGWEQYLGLEHRQS